MAISIPGVNLPNPTKALADAQASVAATQQKVADLKAIGKVPPLDALKFDRNKVDQATSNITNNIPGLSNSPISIPSDTDPSALAALKGEAIDKVQGLGDLSDSINPLSQKASDTKTNSTTSGKNMIKQTERLFSVRSRSSAFPDKQGGDRGTRARIRVLYTDLEKSRQARANSGLAGSFDDSDFSSVFDKLTDSNPGGGFSDFLLTNVAVSFNEKVQITQTFGDTETVYYFGKQPVIFNLSGMLIDDVDNQWFNTFIEAYGGIMRGTESARNYELIELILPNMIVVGTIMSLSYNQDSTRDTDIPFTMQMHAKSAIPLPVRLPTQLPTNALNLINWNKAKKLTSFADINNIKKAASTFINDSSLADGLDPLSIIRNTTNLGARLPAGPQGNSTVGADLFRSSIFSPVFGVLTSITKVVKDTTGNIASIISSFTTPVTDVLRDIQNIATQAVGIAKAIEGGINKILNGPLQVLNQLRNTIIALKKAAGVISRLPKTIAQSFQQLIRFGKISTSAAFLTSGGKPGKTKTPLINSGQPYNPALSGRF